MRKIYLYIFVCFAVKAVHLQIVYDLTTVILLTALKRFFARREVPCEMHSDNGKNFVLVNNDIRNIFKSLFKSKGEIENYTVSDSIK